MLLQRNKKRRKTRNKRRRKKRRKRPNKRKSNLNKEKKHRNKIINLLLRKVFKLPKENKKSRMRKECKLTSMVR